MRLRICISPAAHHSASRSSSFSHRFAATLQAQSTFGTILGTVRDVTGAVVPGATVTLTNKGTTAQRTATSDGSGEFTLSNIDVGNYSVTITAGGFEKYSLPELALTARESRRIDASLKLGQSDQTVTVEELAQNVITTEVSNLAQTKVGEELVSLPVAIYSRSTGSTSPISTLTTEAGVQTDDSGNLDIMGATPALLSVTIDGISSVGVEYSGPINEMFPSFNSIEEIRVSESNNNAEFSGVADITTVSKAGTSKYHGGVFENLQNTAMNSGDPFQLTKTKIQMNDFGGTLGGPVNIPHLYAGRDRSFFFASFEALRLPRETPIVTSVPTLAMRGVGGYSDLTSYLTQQCANDSECPTDGLNSLNSGNATPCPSVTPGVLPICGPDGITPIDYTHVPVNTIASNMLTYLMPLPNSGSPDSFTNNYRTNFPSPISANQGDIRLDQTITSKQNIFARFSYKNRQVTSAPDTSCTFNFCQSAGSPLQGSYNIPEIDEGLTFAYNYIFTPKLLNEFRGGYNAQHTSTTQSYSTAQLLQQTGLTVPQTNVNWAEAPQLLINGFMATGGGNPTRQRSQTVELLDNVTWNKGHHNFKFGADFKRLTDHDDNVFGNYSSGWYVFDSSSDVGASIGDPYTAFLQSYPDYTEAATINKATMDGVGYSYAFYGQDDWKITPNLTLNLGLRYELHPPLKETNYNTAFFLPDYNGPGTDGSSVHGAVVVPNAQAESFESQDFIGAISPTPTFTAANKPDCRSPFATPTRTTTAHASASPGVPTATTKQFSAAAGAASSKAPSASHSSPAGPSTPATSASTTRIIRTTVSPRHSAALPRQRLPHLLYRAASPAPPASTTPSPSTTKTPQSSSGTSPSSRTLATASAHASPTSAATAPTSKPSSTSTRSTPTPPGTPTRHSPTHFGASSKASRISPPATTTAAPSRSPAAAARTSPSTPATPSPATSRTPPEPRQAASLAQAGTSSLTASTPASTTATSATTARTASSSPISTIFPLATASASCLTPGH